MEAVESEATPLESTCGTWILGPKGVGKSYYVRNNCGYTEQEILNKNINKWFDGWKNGIHKVILLDDFDKNHQALGHHLK